MKRRLFSMFLAIVMVLSMMSGLCMTASAAAADIAVSDATYYSSGALKSMKTTFYWTSGSATSRLVLMSEKLNSGDFTNYGTYGSMFGSFDAVLAHDNANSTFGIISYSDEKNVGMSTNQEITFNFKETDIPLSKDKTYYVYLWTYWSQSGINKKYYPDNLFAAIKVQDGAVQYTGATGQNSYDESAFTFVKAAEKYDVTVVPAANMSCAANGGAEVQTDLDVPMTEVAYAAVPGYYFPEDYAVASVNGIKVTRVNENEITVSGMPTADTVITLIAPTKKQLALEEVTFLYAYDVQRSPIYPKTGDSISLTSLTYPLVEYEKKGTTNAGTWTLTKIGTYSIIDGTSKDSSVLQTIVNNIASNYTGMTAANVVIHELKDNGKHIAYGVTVAYDEDEELAIFLGDTWYGSGAGYLLTTKAKSGTVTGEADTDVTDWVPPTTYKVEVAGATQGTTNVSMTETIAGDTVTVTVTPGTGYRCTGIEVKTASGGAVTVTPVSRATAGNQWTFTMPAENVTVTASYAANGYTVTYMADGKQVGEVQTVEHGKDATPPTVPAKEGYTGAWDHDGKNITANTVINAVYTIKTYTVTYKADGKVVNTQTVEHGKDATPPAIPAKTGYDKTAPYWDKNGKNITADTEINAVYTVNTYTVTYKVDGEVLETQTVEHGKNATAPAIPAKVGHDKTAPYWDKSSENITADTEINAVYTINTYTVTYKADGKVVETQTVEHGKDAVNPKVPAKTGYSGKWSHDGKNITADTTIIAIYASNPFTGDDSHIYMMGTLMLVSLMAAAFLLVYNKSFLYQGKYEK